MPESRTGGVVRVALSVSMCLLTSSALFVTPEPEECPGDETHSSYLCPPDKICCEQLCCDPELTDADEAILAALLVLMVVGGLLFWCLEWLSRRDRGERRRLLG